MGQKTRTWDKLSNLYAGHFYTTEYILLPATLKVLGNVKNKKILDLGCGTGYFSEILYKRGAIITGVDSSQKMIQIAKSRNKEIKYLVSNAENLSKLYGQKFDYVLMAMVFCCIDDHKTFETIFNEIKKVIKQNGEVVIVDYHPCGFKDLNTPLLKHKLPKAFSYFKSPQKFLVELKNKNNKFLSFPDFHWTLNDYLNVIKKKGFIIKDIYEPRPNRKLLMDSKDALEYFKNNVVYMVIKCKKEICL